MSFTIKRLGSRALLLLTQVEHPPRNGSPYRKAPSLAQGERITLSRSPGRQRANGTPGRTVEDQVTSGSQVQASKLEHHKETFIRWALESHKALISKEGTCPEREFGQPQEV